jgi:hypothetical protein
MMLLTTDGRDGVGGTVPELHARVDAIAPDAPHSPREPVEADGRAAQAVREPDGRPTLPAPGAQCPFCETVGSGHVKYAPVSYLYACGS